MADIADVTWYSFGEWCYKTRLHADGSVVTWGDRGAAVVTVLRSGIRFFPCNQDARNKIVNCQCGFCIRWKQWHLFKSGRSLSARVMSVDRLTGSPGRLIFLGCVFDHNPGPYCYYSLTNIYVVICFDFICVIFRELGIPSIDSLSMLKYGTTIFSHKRKCQKMTPPQAGIQDWPWIWKAPEPIRPACSICLSCGLSEEELTRSSPYFWTGVLPPPYFQLLVKSKPACPSEV